MSIDQGSEKVVLKNDGTLSIPHASLENINHLHISRALHKIAFEGSIYDMLKETKNDIEKTKNYHSSDKYFEIRQYIRSPRRRAYRPYGMMRTGDAGINLSQISFKGGEGNIIGPDVIAYAINFAGARFLCVLSENAEDAIKFVNNQLKEIDLYRWMGTNEIFRNVKGEILLI